MKRQISYITNQLIIIFMIMVFEKVVGHLMIQKSYIYYFVSRIFFGSFIFFFCFYVSLLKIEKYLNALLIK